MATPRDNMNLLPDRERQEGEAALKKVSQSGKPDEVRLSMPQAQKKGEEKKSFLTRWKEKRAKAKQPVAPVMPAPAMPKPAATKPVKAEPVKKAEPAKKEALAKPRPLPPAPRKVEAPSKPVLHKPAPEVKLTAPAVTPAPTTAPVKSASKFHEPDPSTGTAGFSGPKVNLVPEGVARDAEGISWGLYAGTVIVVLGVWVGISGYSLYRASKAEARVQELNARLTQVNTLITEYEKDKTVHVALQKQFSLVSDLLKNHIYWTPFLQKLEETTIPDVYYLGMTANRNGDVTLRTVAKSYTAAARQIRAFERSSSFVKSVQVNQVRQELQKGAALPVPVITFDVLIKLDPAVFAPPEAVATTSNPATPTGASQQQGQTGQGQQLGQQLPQQSGAQPAGQPQMPGAVSPTPNS